MKLSIPFLLIFSFLLNVQFLYGQSDGKRKNAVMQKAHDNQIKKEEFVASDNKKFRVNIYTVDKKSEVGRMHHWFLALTNPTGRILNYAKINLSGYLKSDPTVKFSYINPVFSLCDEGKYVIGFVRVQQSGPWVLEAKIKSGDEEDTITYEIVVADKI